MEKDRIEKESFPEDREHWRLQHQVMRFYDNLIGNEDRNTGNILYTGDWQMWLIDHTRAFTVELALKNPSLIFRCERTLLENAKRLNGELLAEHLGPYLTDRQIEALLKRRDLLIKHVNGLVQKRGDGNVFFSLTD
jgi:hypothetical protein